MDLSSLLILLRSAAASAAQGANEWLPQQSPSAPWWIGVLGYGLLVALCILLLLAFRSRGEYHIEKRFGESDRERVRKAVAAAEQDTVGEIVPVVLGRSDRYPAADLWCGILFALAAYLSAWGIGADWSPPVFLLIALIAGFLGWLASRFLPDLRRRFVAPWRLQELAEEQAFQEFYRYGLYRTAERTGVLLFVSLFERRVVLMADEGIDSKVPSGTWRDIHHLVLDSARSGDLATGLTKAIERIGELLAGPFPWREGDRNELPDRVIIRDT